MNRRDVLKSIVGFFLASKLPEVVAIDAESTPLVRYFEALELPEPALFQLEALPLPIAHKDFFFGSEKIMLAQDFCEQILHVDITPFQEQIINDEIRS